MNVVMIVSHSRSTTFHRSASFMLRDSVRPPITLLKLTPLNLIILFVRGKADIDNVLAQGF